MKWFDNTFLRQAKARNKVIYFALCGALIMTIITSAAGLQITPFLVYGMYSRPEPLTDTFVTYSLEYDGKPYNMPEIWNYHKKAMFNFTIEHYTACRENNKDPYEDKTRNILTKVHLSSDALLHKLYNSGSEITAYPLWLKYYMSENTNTSIRHINIFRVVTEYDHTGSIKPRKKDLILSL